MCEASGRSRHTDLRIGLCLSLSNLKETAWNLRNKFLRSQFVEQTAMVVSIMRHPHVAKQESADMFLGIAMFGDGNQVDGLIHEANQFCQRA